MEMQQKLGLGRGRRLEGWEMENKREGRDRVVEKLESRLIEKYS
jgi:hypothetical protein